MYSSRVTLLNVVGVVASVVACSLCSGTNLPAEITSDQTWRYDESPYHLTRDTTIAEGVTVTVEAGVEVLVDGNFELRVEGRLLVAGSDHYKVFFVPTDRDAVGVWRGIFVTMDGHVEMVSAVIRGAMTNIINAGGFVQMNNCYIERAENDGMFVFGPAWIGLVRCYFNHNGRRGLYIETTEPEGNVWRSRFIANGEYPVYTKATCAEILKRGNRYHFNGKDFIGVCCSAQDDITDVDGWYTQGGVQYDLTAGAGSHELRVSGILLIDKGVAIRASSIDVTGRIDTNGSMEHPVTILPPGDDPKPGDWEGIVLREGSVANFNGLICRYAKTGVYSYGALLTMSDSWMLQQEYDGVRLLGHNYVDISDTRLEDNGRDGLCLEGWRFHSPGVRDCRFIGNGRYPVYAFAGGARLLKSGNTYDGNGTQSIMLQCHNNPDMAQGVHDWSAQGIPFDLRGRADRTMLQVSRFATLNFGPGVQIVGGGIDCGGTLNANGTAATPVAFDAPGQNPQAGQWEGIVLREGARGILTHATIRHALDGVTIMSGDIRLDSCEVTDCEYEGVMVGGNATPVIYGTTIEDNGRYGVCITDRAAPNLGNTDNEATDDDGLNTIRNNGSYEIYNNSPADIYAHNNSWSTTDISAIRADIYDGHDEGDLGEVLVGDVGASTAQQTSTALTITSAVGCSAPNGTVTITCKASRPCDVDVHITNIAGRSIARISEHCAESGMLQLTWNGRNRNGAPVPSGRYLVRIRARTQDGQSAARVIPLQYRRR